ADLVNFRPKVGNEELVKGQKGEPKELHYFYTRQRRQLGLGHAVLCARPLIGDHPVGVALGDSILGVTSQSDIVRRMADELDRTEVDAVIAFETVPHSAVVHYGIAVTGDPT